MKFSPPKPSEREPILKRQQRLKMARSAHAYVRGNTLRFYEWLENSKAKLPQGPAVWICGDCHVGNLGPVADAKGKVEIEVRDLDQTVIGNPAHDLIRLALSLAMAARSSDLPGVTTALILEQVMVGYCAALQGSRTAGKPGKAEKSIRLVLKQALKRKWRHLATERIEDVRPEIPLGEKFWALSEEEKDAINQLFATEEAKKLATCLRGRDGGDEVEVVDAAYWMKGCSSLGRLRYAVLLRVGDGYCLMDIKQATRAAAPAYEGDSGSEAERVVAGARALSPYLGERMLAGRMLKRSVVLRELRPQDLKVELERVSHEEAVAVARFLAGVVGKAHARQMKAAERREWRKQLTEAMVKDLGAPGWLWTSVVELVAAHEVAYLEHCRRYALGVEE